MLTGEGSHTGKEKKIAIGSYKKAESRAQIL